MHKSCKHQNTDTHMHPHTHTDTRTCTHVHTHTDAFFVALQWYFCVDFRVSQRHAECWTPGNPPGWCLRKWQVRRDETGLKSHIQWGQTNSPHSCSLYVTRWNIKLSRTQVLEVMQEDAVCYIKLRLHLFAYICYAIKKTLQHLFSYHCSDISD